MYKFVKFFQLIMAFTLILQGTLRLFASDVMKTFTGFALTFYLYIFAISIVCIECNLLRARVWFYFMNFSLGKFMFYLVMTALCFGSGADVSWFDVLVGVVFALAAVMFITFHFWFKDREMEFVQKLI